MSKLNSKSSFVLAFLFLFIANHLFAQTSGIKDFSKKSYYNGLFSDKEHKVLKKAVKYRLRYEKYFAKAEAYKQKKSDLQVLASVSKDEKAKAKALKKASREERREAKNRVKAFLYAHKANSLRYAMYFSKLNKNTYGADSVRVHYAQKLKDKAEGLFNSAQAEFANAKDLERIPRAAKLTITHQKEMEAIANLETAFAILKNDAEVDIQSMQGQEPVAAKNIASVSGLCYTISVGTFSYIPKKYEIKNLHPVYFEKVNDEITRYTVGIYNDVEKAMNAKSEFSLLGIANPLVLPYNNGKSISLDEAMDMQNKKTTPKSVENEGTTAVDTLAVNRPEMHVSSYKDNWNFVFNKLKLSGKEKTKLLEAEEAMLEARDLLLEAEQKYLKFDSLMHAAHTSPNASEKEAYEGEARVLEAGIFNTLLKSVRFELLSGKTQYNIYKKHLPKSRPAKKTKQYKTGQKFENQAVEFFSLSEEEATSANKKIFKSEIYEGLIKAQNERLMALQLQENAYATYLNFEVNQKLNTDSLVSYYKTQTNKTTKNGTTTRTKTNKTTKNTSTQAYQVESRFLYSKDNPQKQAFNLPDGVVFLNQIGIFKKYPKDDFGALSPLVGERIKGKTFVRFMVGMYRTFDGANAALKELKNQRPKAYTTAYYNGKRISVYKAKMLLKNLSKEDMRTYREIAAEEVEAIENQQAISSFDDQLATSNINTTNLKEIKGLLYTVQLGVFSQAVGKDKFLKLEPIYTDKINTVTRYTYGIYSKFDEAEAEKKRINQLGLTAAFVVAYHNGKKIKLSEAKSKENYKGIVFAVPRAKNQRVKFKIQVGAFSGSVPSKILKKYQKISKKHAVEQMQQNGKTIFTIGQFKTYGEAVKLKKELKKKGIADGFIVAFDGSKKISIKEAQRLLR